MLSAQFFALNRQNLHRAIGEESLVVVAAQSLMQRSSDTVYPFRQESNFYYLTGITEPDVVLVMCGNEQFLILPKKSQAELIFGGAIDCDEIAKVSGIMTIYSHNEGWSRLKKLQISRNKVHTLGAPSARITGADTFFTNPSRRLLLQKLKRSNKNVECVDIREQLCTMRQIKKPEEVEAIQHAIAITAEGFMEVRTAFSQNKSEYEIESVFDSVFKKNQAVHGYQPIVAGGKNACVLHYIKNNQSLRNENLLLMDVGAEVAGYSADITRTYIQQPSSRQQAVFQAVIDVQSYAMSILRPGLPWKSYAQMVNKYMAQELVRLQLIKKPHAAQVHAYFPHGISHSLGLDVHDPCSYQVIEEGMVITVEPGIYIPEESIGVRIEDDVLITKTGAKNLSADVPYA
jgi:Xaa-Pro aminopeptidase